MKNKITPFFLLAILLSLNLTSCKNKSEKPIKTESNTVFKVETDNKDTIKYSEEESKTLDSFKSRLRPDEQLELKTIYTDTVTFLSYDDNYDYWCFLAKKNKDTVQVMYQDISINELVKGDIISIKWELKILQEAGDEDITYLKPCLVSFNKISSSISANKSIKVLWRDTVYDEELKTDINTIVLNKDYQKNITEPERAALGFVATFVGNECEWRSGKPDQNRTNLACKLLSYLNLGYQCSDKHLDFLNQWFLKDTVSLKKLKRCPTIPNGATVQSTFDEILMETDIEKQTIVISYKVSVINVRENSVNRYTKIDTFQYNSEGIRLINSEKKARNSFVVSCGSGCAMIYSENKIVMNRNTKEITFKIEVLVNELLSKEYEETYRYSCNSSNNKAEIKLKGDDKVKTEKLPLEVLKQLKLYIPKLCSN
ncbi:hypothetical protein [Tenacibaculum sp.]|uniref:hypothetical protein n=1 Tax=Tenacibaculum sp. TaxID=1906242 RepID=UPI003AA7B894